MLLFFNLFIFSNLFRNGQAALELMRNGDQFDQKNFVDARNLIMMRIVMSTGAVVYARISEYLTIAPQDGGFVMTVP